MVTVLASYISDPDESCCFERLLESLPSILQHKVRSYRKREDQQTSLVAKCLLRIALRKFVAYDPSILGNLQYDSENRPYIREHSIDFNISHSHHSVGCCFSTTGRVGLDIEKITDINIDDFKHHINESEFAKITSSRDPAIAFFQYWTKLEAVIKADGRGLQIPMNKVMFDVNNACTIDGKVWYTYSLDLYPGYAANVAVDKPLSNQMTVHLYDLPRIINETFADSLSAKIIP